MDVKNRLQFIDFHRGLVLLIMIEVHVVNAFMSPALKATSWYPYLLFINGLVAPSFLFISGFAFVLAADKKLPEFRKFGKTFWKQLSRIGLIFLVGYSLRVPYFSLKRTIFEASSDQWAAFFSVDVLQTIAMGLTFLFILRLLIKSDALFRNLMLGISLVIGIITPAIWQYDFQQHVHPIIANYFNPMHWSLFPLFPWVGFLTAGAYTSSVFLQYRKLEKTSIYFKRMLWGALILIISGHLFITPKLPTYLMLPEPHFFFFTARIGWVLLILWFSREITSKIDFSKLLILDVSRESLLIYWLHLQLIYRKWWDDKSFADVVHESFGIGQVVLFTFALIALMLIVAVTWGNMKRNYPKISKFIAYWTIWASVGLFLIR